MTIYKLAEEFHYYNFLKFFHFLLFYFILPFCNYDTLVEIKKNYIYINMI